MSSHLPVRQQIDAGTQGKGRRTCALPGGRTAHGVNSSARRQCCVGGEEAPQGKGANPPGRMSINSDSLDSVLTLFCLQLATQHHAYLEERNHWIGKVKEMEFILGLKAQERDWLRGNCEKLKTHLQEVQGATTVALEEVWLGATKERGAWMFVCACCTLALIPPVSDGCGGCAQWAGARDIFASPGQSTLHQRLCPLPQHKLIGILIWLATVPVCGSARFGHGRATRAGDAADGQVSQL